MKKKFDKDEEVSEFDTEIGEDEISEEYEDPDIATQKKGIKKSFLFAAAALGIVAILGTAVFINLSNEKAEVLAANQEAVQEANDALNEAQENMEDTVEEAVDAYIEENNGTKMLIDVMDDEDIDAFSLALVEHMTDADLTDSQKEKMQEIITKILKEDDSLTMTSKITLTEAAKAYIADAITEALKDGDSNEALESAVKEILSEQIKSGDAQYTFSDSDIEKIKSEIISSLGNLKGETGASGKDGKDGRDGSNGTNGSNGLNGQNGKTPVKGEDYFTEEEIETISSDIETVLKSFISNDVTALNEELEASILETVNESDTELQALIDANEALAKANADKITEDESWIATLESLLNKNSEDISSNSEKIDENGNKISSNTDSINNNAGKIGENTDSINNNSSRIDENTTNISSNSEKITSNSDQIIKNAKDIETNSNAINSIWEKITELVNNFTAKDEALEGEITDLKDSQVTYEIIDNGDGTYSLSITDPSAE